LAELRSCERKYVVIILRTLLR